MSVPNNIYGNLADALNNLPNAFPRTKSGVEILLLQKIFTPQEAAIAGKLSGEFEPVDSIAIRLRLNPKDLQKTLLGMAKKWQVWFRKHNGDLQFRLAPFIVGIYEGQLTSMNHELAHLFEQYMHEGGKDIMKYNPAIHRALPAISLAKSEWIMPYDDVRALIDKAKMFNVRDCICRVQQGLVGKGCDKPRHNCLTLSLRERPVHQDDISKGQALALLDEAEKAGLVHCVENHQAEITYICNCCGCCCGILRGITEFGLKNSVAAANYFAEIVSDSCAGCATCVDRCQVKAIELKSDIAKVIREKCIGCGLCVTGCPEKAAKLYRKPDSQIVHPPIDYQDWEDQRRDNRLAL